MDQWIEILPISGADGETRRAAERSAWRAVVREKLGSDIEISYNPLGAPVLPDGRGYIGVSHTHGAALPYRNGRQTKKLYETGWIAVVWSPTPCAVDIEPKGREISSETLARMAGYVGNGVSLGPVNSLGPLEKWCALEAVYKFRSLAGYDPDPDALRFEPHPELVVAVIF